MEITLQAIRAHRLWAHHLDRRRTMDHLLEAAGACGVQNSPPGAWEAAMFQRLQGCTLAQLQQALYQEKSLLQAWSYRGAPVVFPTAERGTFLTPLLAQPGEEPWIYTRGITAALDVLQMSQEELLALVRQAASYLDSHTVQSKESLDQGLAQVVREQLPLEKRSLWDGPSMYGQPDRQTVGGAVVSFLLRPCSFSSLVVFGERAGNTPTFTSMASWLGTVPPETGDGARALAKKFLHCYGLTTLAAFQSWLGSSPGQARRLWNCAAQDMVPVQVEGKKRFALAEDLTALQEGCPIGEELHLLGPHDPYLDLRDREVILPNRALHRTVWRTVGNPGVILRKGLVVGIWTAKTRQRSLGLSLQLWETFTPGQRQALQTQGEAYAAFRGLTLKECKMEYLVP